MGCGKTGVGEIERNFGKAGATEKRISNDAKVMCRCLLTYPFFLPEPDSLYLPDGLFQEATPFAEGGKGRG